MRVTIDGTPEEIAALVLAAQERREMSPEAFNRALDTALVSVSSVKTVERKQIRKMESYGFSPSGFNQIIVFRSEEDFKEALTFNHNMTAIMGDDKHTKEFYPGVFIAGVKASLPRGK